MSDTKRSILLIGESNVGKTHYGAQFLKRLIVGGNGLRMDGAATNLKPFEAALENLAEGYATIHTPATAFVESVWPINSTDGNRAELIWPDYGGEQMRAISADRRISAPWRDRVQRSTDWVMLIRLQIMRAGDDLFTRPLSELAGREARPSEHKCSDQSRLIELLQIFLYAAGLHHDNRLTSPNLTILLTCWDELGVEELVTPISLFRERMPMLAAYIENTWRRPIIWGLSALSKPLSMKDPDRDFAVHGPESFGYVIDPHGARFNDITLPIERLLETEIRG